MVNGGSALVVSVDTRPSALTSWGPFRGDRGGSQLRSATTRQQEGKMDFGAAMFFTDYSMTPVELGQALEARGFESVWAPEHSHIPSTRKTRLHPAASLRSGITT